MSKMHTVLITWKKPDDGGRKILPSGQSYTTVVSFDKETSSFPDESWSLTIEFLDPPTYDTPIKALAHFLTSDAPSDLLEVGTQFALLEGNRVVAYGEVIGDNSTQ
jgi:hypothetical protein